MQKRKVIFWSVFIGSCIVAGAFFLYITKTRLERVNIEELAPQFNGGETQTN